MSPAARKDAPQAIKMHGSGPMPTVHLSDCDRRRIIIDHSETDVHARSAQPTAISRLKTWSECHFRWYSSEEAPVLPLTPDLYTTGVSQLKEQDHACVGKLISVAKDAHLGDGHPGTEFLAREARRTLGEDLRDQQGRRWFGGHSLRATGVRRLARLAIPTAVIGLVVWWSSQVILRDTRDAPLRGLTQEYRRRAYSLGNTATYTFENVFKEMTPKIRKALHDIAEGHKYQEERFKELEGRLDKIDVKLCAPPLVQNFASGISHRADTTDPMQFRIGDCRLPPCGWKGSSANAWTHRDIPYDVSGRETCGRRLVSERHARPLL